MFNIQLYISKVIKYYAGYFYGILIRFVLFIKFGPSLVMNKCLNLKHLMHAGGTNFGEL